MYVVGQREDVAARAPDAQARFHQPRSETLGCQTLGQIQEADVADRAPAEVAHGIERKLGQVRHFGSRQHRVLQSSRQRARVDELERHIDPVLALELLFDLPIGDDVVRRREREHHVGLGLGPANLRPHHAHHRGNGDGGQPEWRLAVRIPLDEPQRVTSPRILSCRRAGRELEACRRMARSWRSGFCGSSKTTFVSAAPTPRCIEKSVGEASARCGSHSCPAQAPWMPCRVRVAAGSARQVDSGWMQRWDADVSEAVVPRSA